MGTQAHDNLYSMQGQISSGSTKFNKLIFVSKVHYNLVMAIQMIQQNLNVNSTLIHVKGHQDTGATTILLQMAWMNIEMDMATKQKVDSTMPYSGPWKMSGEPWSCKIEGQKLVRNIERQLWEHMHTAPIMDS